MGWRSGKPKITGSSTRVKTEDPRKPEAACEANRIISGQHEVLTVRRSTETEQRAEK